MIESLQHLTAKKYAEGLLAAAEGARNWDNNYQCGLYWHACPGGNNWCTEEGIATRFDACLG